MNTFSDIINLKAIHRPISIIIKFHQHASPDMILFYERKQNIAHCSV